MVPIKNFRWWIAGLLALAISLNYLDRQSFPVVISEIKKDIPLSDDEYGRLTSLFLFAYGLMYAGGGRIIDALGTRVGYAVMIVWWSAANFMLGTVSSVFGLGLFRFLLGLGEGGGFPGAVKAVSEWFPARERALAVGIFNSGSSLGSIVAPPLIALIVLQLNWRWVFFLTGGVGFLWVLIWLKFYDTPDKSRHLTDSERQYLQGALGAEPPARVKPIPWLHLFRYRQVWGLVSAKFFSDAAWYFFIFWLPKYLTEVRGLKIKEIGYYAWIPYAVAGFGCFLGGWFSSYLVRRGRTIDRARKTTLCLGVALMPISLLIAAAPLPWVIVFFSMAMFGHQFWSTVVQTLPTDIFPSRVVGSVAGLSGAAGAFGGMFFSLIVGGLVKHSGYAPAFLIAGLLHPLSLLLIFLVVKKIEPIDEVAV